MPIRVCCMWVGRRWTTSRSTFAQIGFEFEVLEPPELVEQVRVLAGLFGRAAGFSR